MKKRIVELPLVAPVYSTYHSGIYSAVIVDNPSIRNWYLNQAVILTCDRKFLRGYTTPLIKVIGMDNPHLIRHTVSMRFLRGYIHTVIRNMLDEGYYIHFDGIDDYYVEGKSWYKERHFSHDGAICGYNQNEKTYCLYAYDKDWIYRKFWTPQASFEAGKEARIRLGHYGCLCAIKPKGDIVEFSPDTACEKIAEYLDSNLEKYPKEDDGPVYGIVVQDYIAMSENFMMALFHMIGWIVEFFE